jgi:hypothetical protein
MRTGLALLLILAAAPALAGWKQDFAAWSKGRELSADQVHDACWAFASRYPLGKSRTVHYGDAELEEWTGPRPRVFMHCVEHYGQEVFGE